MITVTEKRVKEIYKFIEDSYKHIGNIKKDILAVEKEIGLDKIEHVDHIQGSDMEMWRCSKCGEQYVAGEVLVCPKCVKVIK